MPREFVPAPSDESQLLRDIMERCQMPVPTMIRVRAERADVHDEIRVAEQNGDTERVAALRESNKDLLDEDRESVLERWVKENRERGEQGDRAAAQAAARYQRELDELRERSTVDPENVEDDEDIEPENVNTEPDTGSGKEGEPS